MSVHHRMRGILGAVVLAATALALAACTTSTEGSAEGTTTATTANTTTTVAAPATDSALTIEELHGLLPSGDAAGPEFTAVDIEPDASGGSSADDPLTEAMRRECPVSKELMDTDSGDPSTYAARLFNADDGRQIGVFLLPASDPRTGFTDSAELDALIDATDRCPQITATDQNLDYTVDLQGSQSDAFGSFGATISGTIRLTGGPLEAPAAIHMNIEIFEVGDVDVMVQTTSGLGANGDEYPIDPAISTRIATDLDRRLQDFQATY